MQPTTGATEAKPTNAMKRMTMYEIRQEVVKEIDSIDRLKDRAFEEHDFKRFYELSERMKGLFFAYHLINGNNDLVNLYKINNEI